MWEGYKDISWTCRKISPSSSDFEDVLFKICFVFVVTGILPRSCACRQELDHRAVFSALGERFLII